MTKLHKAAAAFFISALMCLSGCAEHGGSPAQEPDNSSSDSNLSESIESKNSLEISDDSTPDNSASSDDPKIPSDSESEPDLQTLIENYPVDIIDFPDGSSISKYEATSASNKNQTYFLGFDFSFIRYVEAPLYTTLDDPQTMNWETGEFIESPVVKSPAYIKVKAGDVLDNGLVVKSAYHSVVPISKNSDEGAYTFDTEVEFDGKLVLSGVLYCHSGGNEYFGGAGNLFFFADPALSDPVPMTSGYEVFGGFVDRTDKFAAVYDAPNFHLGNINDLSVDLSEIIDLGESVKVKITIEDISISYSNTLAKSINGTLVSVEPIT